MATRRKRHRLGQLSKTYRKTDGRRSVCRLLNKNLIEQVVSTQSMAVGCYGLIVGQLACQRTSLIPTNLEEKSILTHRYLFEMISRAVKEAYKTGYEGRVYV